MHADQSGQMNSGFHLAILVLWSILEILGQAKLFLFCIQRNSG